jgi:glutamate dehydrogenase
VFNKHELQVMESFLIFNKLVFVPFPTSMNNLSFSNLNRHVLKTNFYQPTKVALSFRLAPEFLPEIEYPKKPFGMFFVIGMFSSQPRLFVRLLTSEMLDVGNDFRGFHIRFRDVARGGIRIVMSRNKEYV